MAEIFLVCEPERAKWHWITVSLEKSRWASCRWNSKSKDAARAGFDDCVAAWEASLFICFHLLDVSLCRNRLYLTTVSLTENSSSSSRMTLAGKGLFFLLLSLSPVCGFSLYLFPLNVPAYREKMRDLPLVSLFCSCILPEPREPAADKKEGQQHKVTFVPQDRK